MKVKSILVMALMFMVILLAACGNQTATPSKDTDSESNTNTNETKVDFPKKAITIVYHSSAGSGGDLFLRNMAKPLEKILGVPVLVENRTGASGANAWSYVKSAKADGYTLLGTSSTLISAPILSDMGISYQDFKPLAQNFLDPQLLYVKADSQFNTAKELIDYELSNPQELNWARSTPSSGDTISLAMISQATSIDPKYVAFEGGSEALVGVLGGHVQVAVGEYSELRGQIESGDIKVLASLTAERHPILTDIPTFTELGWDVVVMRPRAVMAPKDTPDEITAILIDALSKVYEDEDFKKVFEDEGLVPEYAPGEELMQIYADLDTYLNELLK
jgi:putative tricarboxylic transport membrane protein